MSATTASFWNTWTTEVQAVENVVKTITMVTAFEKTEDAYNSYAAMGHKYSGLAQNATQSDEAIPAAQMTEVTKAFTSFTSALHSLLSTTLGKYGLFEVAGTYYKTAAILRQLEGVVDEHSFAIVAAGGNVSEDKNSIDKKLAETIKKFDGGPGARD